MEDVGFDVDVLVVEVEFDECPVGEDVDLRLRPGGAGCFVVPVADAGCVVVGSAAGVVWAVGAGLAG